MRSYHNFIGVDVGKFEFVVCVYGSKKVQTYTNDEKGIESFIKKNNSLLASGFTVLEVTGGYEMVLLLTLCSEGYTVHRANTRHVKNFIRSYGNGAKTDKLDANALARYSYERHTSLACFIPQSSQALALYELVQRRQDLVKMRTAEKNRLQAPRVNVIKSSFEAMLEVLNTQIEWVDSEIQSIVQQDDILTKKREILCTVPGIGNIISNSFLVLVPELGSLNRREIASLTGVAPKANDSGEFKGYRSVSAGRESVKPLLFIAAMAARNSNSDLKAFYEKLIANGKKKKVALVALMRKIIIIANARLKGAFPIEIAEN